MGTVTASIQQIEQQIFLKKGKEKLRAGQKLSFSGMRLQ